jgi:hypothetical protein
VGSIQPTSPDRPSHPERPDDPVHADHQPAARAARREPPGARRDRSRKKWQKRSSSAPSPT